MAAKDLVIVHDYLTQRGGAERVVLAMMEAFPDARLVTSVYDADRTYPEFRRYDIETLWPDKVGLLRSDPRRALPLLARAFAAHHIEGEAVLISSSGFAHGVSTDAPKVVYCHNPPRWLYQEDDYLSDQPAVVRRGLKILRKSLLTADQRAAASCTTYLANSRNVRARIVRAYGRDAEIVHPPVLIDAAGEREPIPGVEPGFLLNVGRPRGYKNALAVCQAVESLPDERLVLVGGRPEHPYHGQWSDRIVGLRGLSDAQMRWLYANCRALVAVSREDFGLTPLEANAFGRPVVALQAGGYCDSVEPGISGVFSSSAEPADVREAILRMCAIDWDPVVIRAHAACFGEGMFADALHRVICDTAGVDVERRHPVRPEVFSWAAPLDLHVPAYDEHEVGLLDEHALVTA